MARPLRIQFPNATYHITCRGIRREAIFPADKDRQEFIDKMNATLTKYSYVLYAYCLMPNHYHLFLQTPLANLSAGLHDLNASYANWLKSKYKLVGHVFQGRFKSILVDTETYAVNLSIYIHLNPCRWKLAKRPEDYAWSSCRDYLEMRDSPTPALEPKRVLLILASDETAARVRYRRLLRERRDMVDPLKASFRRIALGSPTFVDRIRHIINERATKHGVREFSSRDFKACRAVSPAEVFEAMAGVAGCAVSEILTKRRGRPWRAMGMFLVKKLCPIGLRKAGEVWGVDYSTISVTAKNFSLILAESEELQRQTKAIEEMVSRRRPGSGSQNSNFKT
jgi:putative transposase